MDALNRSRGASTASTPALSMSSSTTVSSDESLMTDDVDNSDGLSLPSVPPTSEQIFTTVHSEFGHCANESFRYDSSARPGDSYDAEEPDPPYYILLSTYISYIFLIMLGHLRDFIGKRFRPSSYEHLKEKNVRSQFPV